VGYKGPERRQYKRVRNRHAKISIKFNENGWQLVAIINYGLGGMLCYCTEQIKPKTIAEVRIDIPGENTPIKCKAQVIRCDKVDNDMYLLAFGFEGVNKEIEDRLKKAIEDGF